MASRSLFSTAHVALLRDAPFAALYFSAYELMKDFQRWASGKKEEEKLRRIHTFFGGAFAGAFACFCTNPLDVVKTYVNYLFLADLWIRSLISGLGISVLTKST